MENKANVPNSPRRVEIMSRRRIAIAAASLQMLTTRGRPSPLDLRFQRVFQTVGGLLHDLARQIELLRVLVHRRLEREQFRLRELLPPQTPANQLVEAALPPLEILDHLLHRRGDSADLLSRRGTRPRRPGSDRGPFGSTDLLHPA